MVDWLNKADEAKNNMVKRIIFFIGLVLLG
jgi:hypothetical protein